MMVPPSPGRVIGDFTVQGRGPDLTRLLHLLIAASHDSEMPVYLRRWQWSPNADGLSISGNLHRAFQLGDGQVEFSLVAHFHQHDPLFVPLAEALLKDVPLVLPAETPP